MKLSARPRIAVLCVTVLAVLVVGCERNAGGQTFSVPESPVISRRARWAMADRGYVALRSEPRLDARITSHMRGGEIAEIHERSGFRETQFGTREHWYHVRFEEVEAWVHGAQIQRFELMRQAENAARGWSDESRAEERWADD